MICGYGRHLQSIVPGRRSQEVALLKELGLGLVWRC